VSINPESGNANRLRLFVGSRQRLLLGAASIGSVLIAWELASRGGLISELFYSRPSQVVAAAIQEVQVPRFWNDVWTSTLEFVIGLVLAMVSGVPMGIMMGMSRRISYVFAPIATFIYAIPRVALLPLVFLALGLTLWSKVAIVFIGAWTVILLNTFDGVRTVDPRLLTVARLFNASYLTVFRSVVLRGSVPFILAGIRLGIGRAMIGVVVGELYGATAGLGFMITVASNNLQIDRVLFATSLFIAFGLIAVEAMRRVEQAIAPWRTEMLRVR
jgi:NitT/TauT family transport system permease protein